MSKTKRYYQCSFTKLNKSRRHRLDRKWMFFIDRNYWVNAVEFENMKNARMNKVARELGYRSYRQMFFKKCAFRLRKGLLTKRLRHFRCGVPERSSFSVWNEKWGFFDEEYDEDSSDKWFHFNESSISKKTIEESFFYFEEISISKESDACYAGDAVDERFYHYGKRKDNRGIRF